MRETPTDAARPDDGFEAARRAILAAALDRAPYEGWTRIMMSRAAADAREDRATIAAAFPRGVADLLTYWSGERDADMGAAMTGPAFKSLRIREKVAFAVEKRLELLRPHKEAARRAAATLALPHYVSLGAKLAWNTADAVWRGLGDASTDFNYYSKRAILTGVWTTTFARWLADDTPDEEKTRAFLAARIENVMQIEKAKAKLRDAGIDPAKPASWLAKLRYPRRQGDRPSPKDPHAAREAKVDEALEETFPASDPPYWSGGNRA